MEAISDTARYTLVATFAMLAAFHFCADWLPGAAYHRKANAPTATPLVAVLLGFSAAFLAIPHTHIWGVALAFIALFAVVVGLLRNELYICAILGMIVMMALPIFIAVAPLS